MQPSQVRPIRDMILLQPEPLEETSKGGILIPRTAKAKHLFGRILAMGPGRITDSGRRVEIDGIKVGDRVIVSAHNMGQVIDRIGGEDGPMLLPEMDIEAVIES
jgi:chaperonin GroES